MEQADASLAILSLLTSALPVVCLLVFASLLWRYDRDPDRLKRLIVDGADQAARVLVVSSWLNHRVGLLNTLALPPGSGLLLSKSSAVHTLGMVFPIDVVFLSKDGQVLAMHHEVPPGVRRVAGPRGTTQTLELGAGEALGRLRLAAGKVLTFT